MKKLLLASLFVLSTALSVRADTILSDYNPAVVILTGIRDHTSYSGRFDLDGYNAATMKVDSAWVEFTFFDLGLFDGESFTVKFGSAPNFHPENSFGSGSFFWNLTLPASSADKDLVGSVLFELDSTGSLNYTVQRTSGNFSLTSAYLEAHVSARQVPDGATTALLLGLGLIGLASLSRLRLQRVKA